MRGRSSAARKHKNFPKTPKKLPLYKRDDLVWNESGFWKYEEIKHVRKTI